MFEIERRHAQQSREAEQQGGPPGDGFRPQASQLDLGHETWQVAPESGPMFNSKTGCLLFKGGVLLTS